MSSYDRRNGGRSDRLTVAGLAAVIVVGVFVVCVILILAKSLFPSNKPEVTEEVFTGTKSESSEAPAVLDNTSAGAEVIVDESGASADGSSLAEGDSAADLSSADDSSSRIDGETATLSQTAYLRSSGDENAEPLLSISAGEQVTVIDAPAGSEYVHVRYYDYDGWVWNGYLY